jgi:hypothetical protein
LINARSHATSAVHAASNAAFPMAMPAAVGPMQDSLSMPKVDIDLRCRSMPIDAFRSESALHGRAFFLLFYLPS